MSKQDITHQLIQTVDELSEPEALHGICHEHRDGDPLPSAKEFGRDNRTLTFYSLSRLLWKVVG